MKKRNMIGFEVEDNGPGKGASLLLTYLFQSNLSDISGFNQGIIKNFSAFLFESDFIFHFFEQWNTGTENDGNSGYYQFVNQIQLKKRLNRLTAINIEIVKSPFIE